MPNEALKVLEQRAHQLREDIEDRQYHRNHLQKAINLAKDKLSMVEADLLAHDRETHRLVRARTEVDKAIDELRKVDDDPNLLEIE